MFITKQTIAVSSDTANWTGKRAAVGSDINGNLLSVHVSDGGSTNEKFTLYRGATELGNLVMSQVFQSSAQTYNPRDSMTDGSTASRTVSSTGSIKFPYCFANEKPTVILSGTAKSADITLYVEGVTSTGQTEGA